jgi:hypothetical protein
VYGLKTRNQRPCGQVTVNADAVSVRKAHLRYEEV